MHINMYIYIYILYIYTYIYICTCIHTFIRIRKHIYIYNCRWTPSDSAQHQCISCIQHAAVRCTTLQQTATHCNKLQRTTTHCNTLQHTALHMAILGGHHQVPAKCRCISCIRRKIVCRGHLLSLFMPLLTTLTPGKICVCVCLCVCVYVCVSHSLRHC